ncbi:uracil-DNA glycosylase [Chryseomicrobium palamuruense]|uniref:Uracil-DNA glycosylase n=1 Tax=Chryseomicrobium palamuruense TaxID=682973 RepID=A0ABV8UUP0_9BACL
MHFQIPEKLMELGKKRIEGHAVEGFVRGGGPLKPKLLLVGEAPGENEAIQSKPFVGRAGVELDKSLESIGLTREDVYMTSPVRSRPYQWKKKKLRTGEVIQKKYNRAPNNQELLAHAPILDYEIDQLDPVLLVPLGNVGLQRLLGRGYKVSEWNGKLITHPIRRLTNLETDEFNWTQKSYTIVPTFHPAAVFYNPKLRPQVEENWKQIGYFLKKMEN